MVANFGMAAALETVRPEWREPELGHRLPLLRSVSSERPLVLVIGTSRTQNAIAPGVMGFPDEPGSPRIFNFGQAGASPLKELLTLHRVLEAGVRPSAVVVEVFPSSLSGNTPAEVEFREKAARLSASDLQHLYPYCGNPAELRASWLQARLAPWCAQRQVLMSHWAPKWQTWQRRIDFQWESIDAGGFQAVDDISPERREALTAQARKEYIGAFTDFRPGDISMRALRELSGMCRERSIPLAFLIPPVAPWFRASFAPGVYERAFRDLRRLAREEGVTLFPEFAATDAEFMDGHHLLKHGAERYSRILADRDLRPWLATSGLLPK